MSKIYTYTDFVPFATDAAHEERVLRALNWIAPSDPQRLAAAAAILQALHRAGLCEDDNLMVNLRACKNGRTALSFYAARQGSVEYVELLLTVYSDAQPTA